MLGAAVVAVIGWAVLLAAVAVATRPQVGEPGPAVMELPGPESPALVNLLAGGFRMTRAAVPATLLDLCARGFASIQHIGPGQFTLRLAPDAGGDLAPYEAQVLDHVRGLEAHGEVPGAALTTGPPARAEAWWRRFERSVIAEARARGLSRPRWTNGMTTALGALSLVPAFLVARTVMGRYDRDAFILMMWLIPVLMLPLYATKRERDTPLGREAAGRWLGLRDFLSSEGSFADQPPGGVSIWDRYLAYGAAMGVARGAVREMPMGSESATEAWSPYGGRWHVVQVDYPKWLPPGWGNKPGRAIGIGLMGLVPIAFILGVALPLVLGVLTEFTGGWAGLVWAFVAVPVVTATVIGSQMLGMAVLGMLDLRAEPRQVTGLVVRMREVLIRRNKRTYSVQHYIGVDDGSGAEVKAWLVDNAKLQGIRPGVEVTALVTPRLGYVERIRPR